MDWEDMLMFLIYSSGFSIFGIVVFKIIKNALQNRKIRKSRIAIALICTINILLLLSPVLPEVTLETFLPVVLVTSCLMPWILLFAHLSKAIDEKQAREVSNMHLFD